MDPRALSTAHKRKRNAWRTRCDRARRRARTAHTAPARAHPAAPHTRARTHTHTLTLKRMLRSTAPQATCRGRGFKTRPAPDAEFFVLATRMQRHSLGVRRPRLPLSQGRLACAAGDIHGARSLLLHSPLWAERDSVPTMLPSPAERPSRYPRGDSRALPTRALATTLRSRATRAGRPTLPTNC